MTKLQPAGEAPTMIIPSGTEIQVDVHGQLSVRTPGNLVIQNSGQYGTLESARGSIRIESNAEVEAVNVRCADICYIQGTLTAWKVAARSIHLEDKARASIVLQEAERLEVGREARLVGNFGSEKELFLLFSRFAQHFRSLPFFFDRERRQRPAVPEGAGEGRLLQGGEREVARTRSGAGAEPSVAQGRLPDPLFFALVLLERELATRSASGPTPQRVVRELVNLLREGDLEALELTHETLFGRIVEPGSDTRRAHQLIRDYYRETGPSQTG